MEKMPPNGEKIVEQAENKNQEELTRRVEELSRFLLEERDRYEVKLGEVEKKLELIRQNKYKDAGVDTRHLDRRNEHRERSPF